MEVLKKMQSKIEKYKVISIFKTILLIFSSYFLTRYFECNDIQMVPAFFLLLFTEKTLLMYVKNNKEILNRTMNIWLTLYTILFSICMTYAKDLNWFYENQTYSFLLNNLVHRIVYFISFYVLISFVVKCLVIYIHKLDKKIELSKKSKCSLKFIAIFFMIFVLWSPYFLAVYPGILSPDSISQWAQAVGKIGYTDHHPIMSTLLMKVSALILGNTNIAIAAYTIFQMIIMSLVFTYTIITVYKTNISKIISFIMFGYYAFFPIHALYSVTLWKDVLYSGFMLLLSVQIFKLVLTKGENLNNKWQQILTALSVTLVGLFRNNGLYVSLCIVLLIIIMFRKNKRILAVFTIGLIAIFIIKIPIVKILNVKPSHYVESIGIPMRQVASVVVKDKYISESDLQLIDNVLSIEKTKESYNPLVSDSLKFHKDFDRDYLVEHKDEFSKIWLKFLVKYPITYIETYMKCTNHLWNPLSSDAWHYTEIEKNDLGVYQDSKLPEVKKILPELNWKISNLSMFRVFYIYSILFWILLFSIVINIIRKNYYTILILLVPFLNWATLMVASPTARQIRYVYSLYTIIPIILILVFYNLERKNEK
ncbi:MAG: DUF6020 family protein [Clostridia bacterium]|nr:DUF6020 family protein [Clostridia bacterium]